jgi:hypothetical protein
MPDAYVAAFATVHVAVFVNYHLGIFGIAAPAGPATDPLMDPDTFCP